MPAAIEFWQIISQANFLLCHKKLANNCVCTHEKAKKMALIKSNWRWLWAMSHSKRKVAMTRVFHKNIYGHKTVKTCEHFSNRFSHRFHKLFQTWDERSNPKIKVIFNWRQMSLNKEIIANQNGYNFQLKNLWRLRPPNNKECRKCLASNLSESIYEERIITYYGGSRYYLTNRDPRRPRPLLPRYCGSQRDLTRDAWAASV